MAGKTQQWLRTEKNKNNIALFWSDLPWGLIKILLSICEVAKTCCLEMVPLSQEAAGAGKYVSGLIECYRNHLTAVVSSNASNKFDLRVPLLLSMPVFFKFIYLFLWFCSWSVNVEQDFRSFARAYQIHNDKF